MNKMLEITFQNTIGINQETNYMLIIDDIRRRLINETDGSRGCTMMKRILKYNLDYVKDLEELHEKNSN